MKILQMTTYHIEQPDHGGKLRSHYIRRALRRKFTVETLSFNWGEKQDVSSLAVELDKSCWEQLGINGILCDWGICLFLAKDHASYKTISHHIVDFGPDIIMLEQPFLWPLVENFFTDGVLSPKVKVIYSSHNIEVDMKRKIYQKFYSAELSIQYADYVDRIERGVIRACSAAITVSATDAAYIAEVSPGTPVQIYCNGHSRPRNSTEDSKWQSLFAQQKTNWVFIASWHPPNVNGLWELIMALARQQGNKTFNLWVLGHVGNGLLATVTGLNITEYPWLQIMGAVSSQDIDSAILCSSGIVLPIWEGGGSNIKTAQALLSSKCILGSEYSFRTFEHFSAEPGVYLVDDPDRLAKLMIGIIPGDRYVRSEQVQALEWEIILHRLPSFICEILN